MGEVHRHPVVWGFPENGAPITLLEGMTSNTSFRAPGIYPQQITGRAVIVGGHFGSPDDVVADAIYADFTVLPEWLGWMHVRERTEGRAVEIAFTPPTYPLYLIRDKEVGFAAGWAVQGDGTRDRTIRTRYSPKIAGRSGLESAIREWIIPFQELLTLAVGHPNVVTKLEFVAAQGNDTEPASTRPMEVL